MTKHIIWSSMIDMEAWEDYFNCDYCRDYMSEDEKWQIAAEINDSYLGDEIANLNRKIDGYIVSIRDNGAWNGRYNSVSCLTDNINSIFNDILYALYENEWFVEDGEVQQRIVHHDGITRIVYRKCRDYDAFIEALETSKPSDFRQIVEKYTESIASDVQSVYGFID